MAYPTTSNELDWVKRKYPNLKSVSYRDIDSTLFITLHNGKAINFHFALDERISHILKTFPMKDRLQRLNDTGKL